MSELKFGYIADVDTATTPEDIWDGGGTYEWPTAAGTVSVVSTDAGDDQGLCIAGIDTDYKPLEETVTLNGTTPVVTTASFWRINRMYLTSGAANAGTITATLDSKSASIITAGRGQTLQTIYCVPDISNSEASLKHIWCRAGKAQASYIVAALLTREPGASKPWRTRALYPIDSASPGLDLKYEGDSYLNPGTDMRWTIIEASANNMSAGGGFEILWGPAS